MFDKIKDFIGKTQALFAKIGETGLIQAFLEGMKLLFKFIGKEDAEEIIDAVPIN